MASAIELNAISTVLTGHGLAANTTVTSEITKFHSTSTYVLTANIFSLIGDAPSHAQELLYNSVSSKLMAITDGHYLLDIYPSNITPVSSGTVSYHGNSNVASVSNTVSTQINIPFSYGMAGFANVYTQVFGEISSTFDPVASVQILKNQTYADTGVGHTGLNDLATHGLSSYGSLIASTVSTWGTMYDITNLNLLDDPYVFGQNLLNQGLGKYGNLTVNLAATGLDVTDITHIPSSSTTTTEDLSTELTTSPYGEIPLSSIKQTVTTTIVTGGSVDVIRNIYKQVQGSDLSTMISTTGFSASTVNKITSLDDFLDFYKVVPPNLIDQWATVNVKSFKEFGRFIQSKIGHANFTSWAEIATFMNKIVVPDLSHTTTKSTDSILSSSTVSSITALGTGTGPMNNLVLSDFLGATTGSGYTESYKQTNKVSDTFGATVAASLTTLKSAVLSWLASYVPYSPGSVDPPVPEVPEYIPSFSAINSAVSSLVSLLDDSSTTPQRILAQDLYYIMLNKLSTEVSNLSAHSVKFMTTDSSYTKSFAQGIVSAVSDDSQFYSKQFFANLITNDSYGDTIRAAVAEKLNTELLMSVGIIANNDPQPANAIFQAKAQNIPLSTYLSQNK
jgi:hypothetical protein